MGTGGSWPRGKLGLLGAEAEPRLPCSKTDTAYGYGFWAELQARSACTHAEPPASPGADSAAPRPLPSAAGDCVYLMPAEAGLPPFIGQLQTLQQERDSNRWATIRWYYRRGDGELLGSFESRRCACCSLAAWLALAAGLACTVPHTPGRRPPCAQACGAGGGHTTDL